MLEKIIKSFKNTLFATSLLFTINACGDTAGSYSARPDAGTQRDSEITCFDDDNDGFYSTKDCGTEIDCDDNNNRIFPNATEFCDYEDNNCNGQVDEGVQETFYADRDKDGFGNPKEPLLSCLTPKGDPKDIDIPYADNSDDCNDENAQINPNIAEICDGIDNNCNDLIDEGGDILCNDGLYCNGEEICEGLSGCSPGTSIDCSENNIDEISRCNYIPDSIIGTWDFRSAFSSSCEETTGAYRCVTGDYSISHACDIAQCEAECETDDDCLPTNCNDLDGCYEGTFRDYVSVNNFCLPDCNCTSNSCDDYVEAITDGDDDGYDIECDGDCDDTRREINPGVEEIIDGIDNDCDGVVDPSRWLDVSAGLYHTCGIRLDGRAQCWGYNNYGQSDVPEEETFVQVSAGDYHSCGLKEDGSVSCWGREGILPTPPEGERYIQISAGTSHTCGLREDNTVARWPRTTRDIEGTFTQISAGGRGYTCGVRTDNTLSCGPPGGTYIQVDVGGYDTDPHVCAIRTDDTLICWGRNGEGQANPPEGTFIQVSAGRAHTCGLRTDNTTVCWGSRSGGNPSGTFTEIDAGGDHNCGLREDNTMVCWGRNGEGQCDVPEE